MRRSVHPHFAAINILSRMHRPVLWAAIAALLLTSGLPVAPATAQQLDTYENAQFGFEIAFDTEAWEADVLDPTSGLVTFNGPAFATFINILGTTTYTDSTITDCVIAEAEAAIGSGGFDNFAEFPATDADADDYPGFVAGNYLALSADLVSQGDILPLVFFISCAILDDGVTIILSQLVPLQFYEAAWEARQSLMAGFARTGTSDSTTLPDDRRDEIDDDSNDPFSGFRRPDAAGFEDQSPRLDDDDDDRADENVGDTDDFDTLPPVANPERAVSTNETFSINYDDGYWNVIDSGFDPLDDGDYLTLASENGVFRVAEYSGGGGGDMTDCVLEYSERYLERDGAVVDWAYVPFEGDEEILLDDGGDLALALAAVLYEDARGTFEYAYTVGCARIDDQTALTVVHVVTIDDFEDELPYVIQLIEGVGTA